MRTITLKVETLDGALQSFSTSWKTGDAKPSTVAFASWELMHRLLTPKRLNLLRALCGNGPIGIGELASRAGLDVNDLHADVAALVSAGIVDQSSEGLAFPYDRIHVEFDIDAAA